MHRGDSARRSMPRAPCKWGFVEAEMRLGEEGQVVEEEIQDGTSQMRKAWDPFGLASAGARKTPGGCNPE